jgi:cell division protein FtsQ
MSVNTWFQKFLKPFKFFLVFLILCLIFYLLLYEIDSTFKIKKIEIEGEKKQSLYGVNDYQNKNLILISEKEVEKKIIENNSIIKKITVKKDWPSTLRLSIEYYQPIASLVVTNGYLKLSEDGRILSKTKNSEQDLPVINYYQKLNSQSLSVGDRLSFKDILTSLYFIDRLTDLNLQTQSLDIVGDNMILFNLKDQQKIIFSSDKEKELQEYELREIIIQFKVEGKEFQKIDLRFEKPVVEF